MGTRLPVGQESWRVTGVSYSAGQRICKARRKEAMTPTTWVWFLLGAMVVAIAVLLVIVL